MVAIQWLRRLFTHFCKFPDNKSTKTSLKKSLKGRNEKMLRVFSDLFHFKFSVNLSVFLTFSDFLNKKSAPRRLTEREKERERERQTQREREREKERERIGRYVTQ
jgi:hypothetical protein